MSRPFRKLLWVFAALAALSGAAVGGTSTRWFQRALERRVIAHLESLTGGRVEVRALRFNPASLKITLLGLRLHGAELPPEPPLFSAKTVVARLKLTSLVRRKLLLRSLEWDNAEIHLLTKPDGSTNFRGTPESLGADQAVGELVDLSVGRLVLGHTDVYWNDQRLPLDLDAGDVAILVRFDRKRRYTGSVSSTGTRIKTSNWASRPITFSSLFELSRAGLSIPSLTWQSPGFTGRCSINLRPLPAFETVFDYQTTLEVPEIAKALRIAELGGGSVNLAGKAVYREGKFEARGQIRARDLSFQSSVFSPGRIDLAADYLADRRHIDIVNLKLSALAGTAEGQMGISFQSPAPDFVVRVELRGLNMSRALSSFPRSEAFSSRLHLDARIDGTAGATWNGTFENLKSQFDLQFHPLAGRGASALPTEGYARGRAGTSNGLFVELREARLQTPASTIQAQGTMGTSHSNLGVRFATSNFDEWGHLAEFLAGSTTPIPLSLQSQASFSGRAAGAFSRPEIRGRVEAGAFNFHGWTWDSFAANVFVAPDFVQISSAQLGKGTSALNLNASAKLNNWRLLVDSRVQLAAQAQHTPLEGLKAALGIPFPMAGLATGHLNLEGTPSDLAGNGALRVEKGALAGEPFDSLTTNVRVAASVFNLEEIHLSSGHGRLVGEISFDPSRKHFSGELQGTDFSIADYEPLRRVVRPSARSTPLDGRAGFDIRGEGTPEDVRLLATWSLRDLSLNGSALGDLRGSVQWQGNEMRIEGDCQGPGGVLNFSGEARTEDKWPLALKGQFSDLRADPWIRTFLNGKFNALVTARGSFDLEGPLKEPERIEARSQAQSLEVSFSSLTWKNDQPIRLRFADSVLTASRFRMRGPSTDLMIEGSVRFKDPAAISVNTQGEAEATLLSLLDSRIQARGRSELKLQISGSPAQPLLNGTLDIQDVNLGYGDLPFRLSGLTGEVRLEGERATSRSLRGVSGGGTVTLAGFATLTEIPRFEIQADLDQVQLSYPTDFTSVLIGTLRLAGTSERAQLGGELTVRQMFISEKFNLLTRMIQGSSLAGGQLPTLRSPFASRAQLNVQVSSTPPIRLDTPDFRLVADIDLRLQGTLASPVEVGTVHFRSGDAVFRGNRYKLNRGELNMTNPFRTQPLLDLEAETRIERYDLTLDISGLLDRLKVAYRSDPPLPTADILSLLALGFSRQQKEMSTTGGRPLPAVGASALLSEALSSQMSGRIQRLFGVSRVKIDPNVGGPGNPGGTRVTVEQQVTRDLTLTYVTNTAGAQYRVIQFEWALNDNVSMVGVRDQNGIFGVEMKFRRRFK